MKARVKWVENVAFLGETESNHAVLMDGAPAVGGRNLGPRPMEMLLLGAGGCTSFDVISILKKSRQAVTDCYVELEAARADKGATIWGGLGPQFQASYTYAGLSTHVMGRTTGMHEQNRAAGKAGFNLGLSTFGQVKTAKANARLAALQVEAEVDQVRAAVVKAQQNSLTTGKLVPAAAREVESAEESLRLTQANLQAGTMLTLDVLQAQDAAERARLHYAAAVIHYNQSQVNLLAALGLLEEASTEQNAATQPSGTQPAPNREK